MWVKICGGGRGSAVVEFVVEEEDVVEGTRRFGRGRMGRDEMREGGRVMEVGEEGYCWDA